MNQIKSFIGYIFEMDEIVAYKVLTFDINLNLNHSFVF